MRITNSKYCRLKLKKITALLLSAAVIHGSILPLPCQASPVAEPMIRLPEILGQIEETYAGTSGKTIIYIQDAHDSFEAQENIARILDFLVTDHEIKTVFEEGTESNVPTDAYFHSIQDPAVKQKVSYFLMDQLRIGGAEYAHINRTKDFRLLGADSLKLHHAGTSAYRRIARHNERIQADLESLHRELTGLAHRHWPRPLKAWLRNRTAYHQKKMELIPYLKETKRLLPESAKKSFGQNYPTVDLILRAAESQDPALAEKISSSDGTSLFREILGLEDAAATAFLNKTRDRTLFKYFKTVEIIQKLSRFELSQQEFEAVKDLLKDFNTEAAADFISANSRGPVVLSKYWERHLKDLRLFYNVAGKRNLCVRKHLAAFKQSKDEDAAVLVFGGFHSQALKDIFRREGFSYVLISPKITSFNPRHHDYYRKLMGLGYRRFQTPAAIQRATTPPRDFTILSVFPEQGPAYSGELSRLEEIVEDLLRQGHAGTPEDILLRMQKPRVRSEARNEDKDKKPLLKSKLPNPVLGNFGLNLRRKKTRQPSSPQLILNAWSWKKDHARRHPHIPITHLTKKYSLKISQIETRIEHMLSKTQKLFPDPENIKIHLGEHLNQPIAIQENDLTVDISVFNLGLNHFNLLIDYGMDHMAWTTRISHEDSRIRELVAYFEASRDYLPLDSASKKRLKNLRSMMKRLNAMGWDTNPHTAYFRALEMAATRRAVQREIAPPPLKEGEAPPSAFKRVQRAMAFRKAMSLTVGYSLPNLLNVPKNKAFQKKTTVLIVRKFLEPLAEEVRFVQRHKGVTLATSRTMLRQNSYLLGAVRVHGVNVLVPHLDFLDEEGFLAKAQLGPSSQLVHLISSAEIQPGTTYANALAGYELLTLLAGKEWVQTALRQMRAKQIKTDALEAFFAQYWILWLNHMPPSVSVEFQTFLDGIRQNVYRNGIDFLEKRNAPELIIQLLELVHHTQHQMQAFVRASVHPQETKNLAQETFEQSAEKIISLWGIAAAPHLAGIDVSQLSLPSETTQILLSLLRSHPDAFQQSLRRAAQHRRFLQDPVLSNAVFFLCEITRTPITEDFRGILMALTLDQFTPMVGIDLFSPEPAQARTRTSFRYLTAVQSPESARLLAERAARYLREEPEPAAGFASYAPRILGLQTEDGGSLGPVLDFMLKSIQTEVNPHRQSAKGKALIEILEKLPRERREQMIAAVVGSHEDIQEILQQKDPLKAYLLAHLASENVGRYLNDMGLSVEEIRQKLHGIAPALRKKVIAHLDHARAVRDREIYETFIGPVPEDVEDYETGERLPNYYRLLGIPRPGGIALADYLKIMEKSYRDLAVIYHSDLFQDQPEEEQKQAAHQMALIAESFGVLHDTEKRNAYDRVIPHDSVFYPQKPWFTVARSESRSEEGKLILPEKVTQALSESGITLPPKEERYLMSLIDQGKRNVREVALAVTEANRHGITPGRMLMIAERHQFNVPMTSLVLDIVKEQGSSVPYVAMWAKQAQQALRGVNFEGKDDRDFWRTASKEDRVAALNAAWALRNIVREYKNHAGASEFLTVRKLFRLYQAIGEAGSVEGVEEVVSAILLVPLQEHELKSELPPPDFLDAWGFEKEPDKYEKNWIYLKRYTDILAMIEESEGLNFSVWDYLTSGRFWPTDDEIEANHQDEYEEEYDFLKQLEPGNLYHFQVDYPQPFDAPAPPSRKGLSVDFRPSTQFPEKSGPLFDANKIIESQNSHVREQVAMFFPYAELASRQSPLREAFYSLAKALLGYDVKLIVYRVPDEPDEALLRNLTALDVETTQKLPGDRNFKNLVASRPSLIHVSADPYYLKDLLAEPNLPWKHMLLKEPSDIWAAYLLAVSSADAKIPGLDNSNGYFEVVGEFLRSELRAYQASLVIRTAA